MAWTWLTRMVRSRGSARILRSNLAPSVRLLESSAKRSKNLVSRGMRRMDKVHSSTVGLPKSGEVKSRVISHARCGGGNRRSLVGRFARDHGRGAAGSANTDDADEGENRRRATGDRLEKAGKELGKIHDRIMGSEGGGSDIT